MRVPIALVGAYARMLPRLQAEEALLAVRTGALGAGTLKSADAKGALAEFSRAAGGRRREKPIAATPAALADMGIGYHEVARD